MSTHHLYIYILYYFHNYFFFFLFLKFKYFLNNNYWKSYQSDLSKLSQLLAHKFSLLDWKWVLFESVKTQLLFYGPNSQFEIKILEICGHSEEWSRMFAINWWILKPWKRQKEEIFICINYTFVFSCKHMAIYCKSEYYCFAVLFCFAINIIMYLKCCSYIWNDCFARKSFRKGIVAWLWNFFMQINYCIKDGIYRSLLLVTSVCFIRFQLHIWWYLIHDFFQLRHVSSLTVMKSLNSPFVLCYSVLLRLELEECDTTSTFCIDQPLTQQSIRFNCRKDVSPETLLFNSLSIHV